MAISVVNGFLCFSSCDVAKAMNGNNPHPHADATAKAAENNTSQIGGPAVVLGGTLKTPGSNGIAPIGAGQSTNPTAPSNQNSATDILA
jgi:hypothetical protein